MMIVKVMMMRCDGDDEDVLNTFNFIVNISTVVVFTIIIIL